MAAPKMSRRAPLPLVSVPPQVDYDDFAEYCELYTRMHRSYTRLILSAVTRRSKRDPPGTAWSHFSQRDLMIAGLAEFEDIIKEGLLCALTVTKKRGLRFCLHLNEKVMDAITTASRTLVMTVSGARQDYPKGTTLNYKMMGRVMVDAMYQATGQCDTHTGLVGVSLFRANFIVWACNEHNTCIPKSRWPDYVLAFLMTGHARLCAHMRPFQLQDDVLRVICAYLL